MKPSLARSLSFWLGVSLLAGIAGLWIGSLRWSCGFAVDARGSGMGIDSLNNTLQIEWFWDASRPLGPWSTGVREPESVNYSLALASPLYETRESGPPSTGESFIIVPYWLAMTAVLVLWLPLLAWRRWVHDRRRRGTPAHLP